MLDTLRLMLRPTSARPRPAVPDGQRAYAIGDIHGRLDLLIALQAAILADDRGRSRAATTVVLLGDLVDRGPDSSGVLAFARQWRATDDVRLILGNHEEMFLASLEDPETFRHFIRFGGRETVLSYAVDAEQFDEAPLEQAHAIMRAAVPASDLAFLDEFGDYVVIGDYLFVHAGVRPGTPLDEQRPADLRWIREPFLASRADHGHCVVHGHTITAEPELRHNRIGIDTGAYMSGRLTALGLEGTERWLIEAWEDMGEIIVTTTAVETV